MATKSFNESLLTDLSLSIDFTKSNGGINKNPVNYRNCSSVELGTRSSTMTATSNEIESLENKVTKRLLFHRSNTTPFKVGSKFKPTIFSKLNNNNNKDEEFQDKFEDTKRLMTILKASIQQPMVFPPIVVEQLKKYKDDPNINNPDPKFWDYFDFEQKQQLIGILRKKMTKKIEKKNKEIQKNEELNKNSKEQKDVKQRTSSQIIERNSSNRLTLSGRYLKSANKLPPIETLPGEIQSKESKRKIVIISINDDRSSIGSASSNTEKRIESALNNEEITENKPQEEVKASVIEVIIDNLDGIDKPGFFELSSNTTHSSRPASNKHKKSLNEEIEYKNEIHIFMSSFFIDSEVERAAILVKVIPELRNFFAVYGYELYYHDCHLETDAISDNHNLEAICLEILNRTIQQNRNENGINYIAIYGQKVGLKELPTRITVDEFESTYQIARHDYEKIRKSSRLFAKKSFAKALSIENSLQEWNFENSMASFDRLNSATREFMNSINTPEPSQFTEKDEDAIFEERPSTRKISKTLLRHNSNSETPVPLQEPSPALLSTTATLPSKNQSVFTLTEKQETQIDIQANSVSVAAKLSKKSSLITQSSELIDPTILNQWYELDKSFNPPLYVLKPISAIFPDINNRKEMNKRQSAKTSWKQAKKSLTAIFQKYGRDFSYYNSLLTITEKELNNFIRLEEISNEFKHNTIKNKLLIIDRTICEYDLNALNDVILHNYFDIKTKLTTEIDTYSIELIQNMRESIDEIVKHKSHLEYKVNWSIGDGISPSNNREHLIYIERLCKQVKEQLFKSWSFIHNNNNNNKNSKSLKHELNQDKIDFDNEIKQHKLMFLKSCKEYLGSKELLHTFKSYLTSSSTVPLILYGEHGCGKTSFLNECLKDISQDRNTKLVVRCCGKTEISTNLRLFLKHLCDEIDLIYTHQIRVKSTESYKKQSNKQKNKTQINDFLTLKNSFSNRLLKATFKNPLVIVLDGIDNLKNEFDDNIINWLPKELPPYVHVILSYNSTGDKGEKLTNLFKKQYGKNNLFKLNSFLTENSKQQDENTQMISYNENLLRKYIEQIFNQQNGTHQRYMSENIIKTFINLYKEISQRIPSSLNPLYCRILFKYIEQAITLKSFTQLNPEGNNVISELYTLTNLKLLLDKYYSYLERKHGDVFVKRVIGYLAAFYYCGGCTENELIDLLSLDDSVLSSVNSSNSEFILYKYVAESHWLALKSSLIEFKIIQEVHNTGGYRCITFKNAVFYDVASDRYFLQRDKSVSYFKQIVNYYLNKHGNMKSVQALKQPWERNYNGVYIANIRRLNHLVYHISQSSPTLDMLKQEIFFNYLYLKNKLKYTSFESLIDDFNLILNNTSADYSLQLQNDNEIKLFLEFLMLSENALRITPSQLYSQLMGRLSNILAASNEQRKQQQQPQAPVDGESGSKQQSENVYQYIKNLINESTKYAIEVDENYCPAFLPTSSFLIQPNNMPCDLLKGFDDNIAALACTSDGTKVVTFEISGVCKLWDLKNMKLMKTLYKINDVPKQVNFAMGNAYLVVVTTENVINIWSIRSSEKLYSINEHENDTPQITIGGGAEAKYLAISYSCKEICFWNLAEFKKTKIIELQESEESVITTTDENEQHNEATNQRNLIDSTSTLGSKIVLSKSCYEDKIGYAFKGTIYAYLVDCKNGAQVGKFCVKYESGLINSIELTSEYFLILCKLTQTRAANMYKIEVHDIKKCQYLRTIGDCVNDNLTDICLNNSGSHLIAISYSDLMQTSEITFWNVESEEHRHLCLRSTSSAPNFLIANDLRFVMTTSAGHLDISSDDLEAKQVKIWNLAARFGQAGGKYQISDDDGIESLTKIKLDNNEYLISRHIENKKLCVWEINESKLLKNQPKLLYEYGANVVETKLKFKLTDIILSYDTNLYVLTDKSSSSNENTSDEESYPIFQTVNVFNLKEQKLEYKITQSFICAFDATEYLIIPNAISTVHENDVVLLGLSETRGHFIIYSVHTGHIIKRMRTNFKEERRKREHAIVSLEPSSVLDNRNEMNNINVDFETFIKSQQQEILVRRKTLISIIRPAANTINMDKPYTIKDMEHDKATKNIEKFIVSGDQKTIIASFHAHHLAVFDLNTFTHVQTLDDLNCMLLLYVSHINHDGSKLIHTNYDTNNKCGYLTIWDCKTGKVKRRLKNETGILCVTMTDDARLVVFCKENGQVKYWKTTEHNSLKSFKYENGMNNQLEFELNTKIYLLSNENAENAQQVLISSGKNISLWDIQKGCLINVFTSDYRFSSHSLFTYNTLLLGLKSSSKLLCLQIPEYKHNSNANNS